MSLFPLRFLQGLLTVLIVGLVMSASGQQQRRKSVLLQPEAAPSGLDFTEPQSPGSSTNASVIGPKTSFGISEKTSRKPYEFFQTEDSLNGILAPPIERQRPQQSAASMKRAKEKLDRKKNWAFSTPEEMYDVQSPEEMMNVREYEADGSPKAPKTTLERYIERMERKKELAASNHVSSDALPNWMKPEEKEEKSLITVEDKSIGGSLFSKRAKSDSANGTAFASPLTIIPDSSSSGDNELFTFSSSGSDKPVMRDAARDARMSEFRQMFDTKSAPPSTFSSGYSSPSANSPSSPNPFSSSSYGGSSYTPQPATPSYAFPTTASTPSPASSYFPAYTAPQPTTPSRLMTPSNPFELPKRKF